uniref:GH57-amylopullulanase n=1 Tax=Cyanobacterium sp. CLg1 TaxID=197335 RepID=V5SMU7_9CHRO|nr:GH57-amylopullulanase [Cyanobacterium sp. CLg1]
MSHPLYVAFIWHQHQPLYKSSLSLSDFGGQYRLPWVRLHGTKDYLDLVLLLAKYPNLHQTVNLVPSLILQLEDYANGKAIDPYLALTLTPCEELETHHRQFIIDHFFSANHHRQISPHERYQQLYEQKQDRGGQWCLEHWQNQDYSDLMAWHNLVWFDPLFWDDPQISRWLAQGKDFTLDDRQQIYQKQREIIQKIIPQHRQMQADGQLEITTSPYTHPILPLLADSKAGRVALPTMELPQQNFQWEEDIPRHLKRAWNFYYDRFGQIPKGLWPSEQSVSPTILPHIAHQGFKWLCSDEAVLGWSLRHFFHRDELGNVDQPEYLYRPYRLTTEQGDLNIVFRDHRLSDLIGFSYSNMDPVKAATDLISHLEAIARKLKQNQEYNEQILENPWLVTIALDGENCWEFYEQDGRTFLESFYSRLSHQSQIQLVTVSEFLEQFPPTETIDSRKLHSGSWIDGNFTTWIGDPIKNKAWDYLATARQMLAKHPEATEESNPQAWEALYAAEGSDWFWWYGEPHYSDHGHIFDQLFREHLIALYQALNEPVPDHLYQSLSSPQKANYNPENFIHPTIDGQGNVEDWLLAGKIKNGATRGTMHQAKLIPNIFYGCDHRHFYLRFDLKQGIKIGKELPSELHIVWYYQDRPGHNNAIPLSKIPNQEPLNYYYRHHLGINLLTQTCWLQEAEDDFHWHDRYCSAQIAIDRCIEIAVPWSDLHVDPDGEIHLLSLFAEEGQYQESYPDDRLIIIKIP